MSIGPGPALPDAADAFLERDRESAVLDDLIRRAAHGEGGVVVVTGPPGVGKTALLRAARRFGGSRRLRGLHARGRELEREIAFGVAAGLLEPLMEPRSAEGQRYVAFLTGRPVTVLDALGPATPGRTRAAASGVTSDQIVRGLHRFVAARCRAGGESGGSVPLLLTVDDAHWSDAGSLRFLCHLADHLDELPIAVVVAARAGGHGPRRPWLDQLASHRHSVAVSPAPLRDDAVAVLVARSFPGACPAFTRACARASGGNPFLLVELLRSLRAIGVPPTDEGAESVATTVPATVLHAVLARLGRLSAPSRRLAHAVAVLGDDVPLVRAAALAGIGPATAEQAADALTAAHLLRPGAPLGFIHPLVGGAIHSDLPRFARARAHRRAAGLLEADGEPLDEIARHLLLTEPEGDERTVAILQTAAARAILRGEAVAAARWLRRALAEPPPSPSRRSALLAELAVVQLRNGDASAARTCRAALELATGPEARSRGHDVLAQILIARGEIEEAAEHSATALSLLDPGGSGWQDMLARHLTAAAFRPGHAAEVRSWLAPIAAKARRGEPPAHGGLRAHLALHLALGGAPAREVARCAAVPQDGSPVVAESNGTLAGLLVHALVLVDELDIAERIADDAIVAAERQGSVVASANAGFHRALCRYPRGALADAWADLERIRVAAAVGGQGAAGWVGALMVHLALDTGRLKAVGAGLRVGRRAPATSMEQAVYLAAAARSLLRDGRPEAAGSAALRAGRMLMDGYGVDHPGLVPWRSLAALAAHAAGRPRDADRLSAEGVARAEALGLRRPLGVALHAAGLVAPVHSSVPLLTRAVAVLEDAPAALERTRALVSLGAALRRANRPAAAREVLRRGLSSADGMGAGPLATRARAELLAAGARPRRGAVTGRDALTPAERRVAELAAGGHTNRQIAQALFVTAKTVETHLTRVYRKLQVPDRSGLRAALGACSAPPARR